MFSRRILTNISNVECGLIIELNQTQHGNVGAVCAVVDVAMSGRSVPSWTWQCRGGLCRRGRGNVGAVCAVVDVAMSGRSVPSWTWQCRGGLCLRGRGNVGAICVVVDVAHSESLTLVLDNRAR